MSAFVDALAPVEWQSHNPYLGREREALLVDLLRPHRWRHHHGLEELRSSKSLYATYVGRVDDMLRMLDDALATVTVVPSAASFLDLGAAQGYVANHLIDRGARDIDAAELSLINIERMWMIRALKGVDAGRIGRLDLQHVNWSESLGRSYDVTLALGVIYHMENPLLFARNLCAATDRVAIVESDTPSFPNNQRFHGYGNIYLHRDQVTVAPGDTRYVTELRPDRQALAELLLEAGFRRVEVVAPRTDAASRFFVTGEKSMVIAEK